MAEFNENKLIQVCSSCKRACCWYGEFMCENSCNASTELKTVKELREIKAGEDEHYWSDEHMKKIYGDSDPFGIKGNDKTAFKMTIDTRKEYLDTIQDFFNKGEYGLGNIVRGVLRKELEELE